MYHTSIACITIDSVIKMDKKYFLQVHLKECKYKIKKTQLPRFINAELGSDSDEDSDDETYGYSDDDYDDDSADDSYHDSDK